MPHNPRTASRDTHAVKPRARRLAAAVPIAVILATVSVIGWSAWPIVAPAREVRVAQAVFDRSIVRNVDRVGNDEIDDAARPPRHTPTVQAAGWLEAEPYYIPCVALADGVVENINVLAGEYVEKGDVVATLIADDARLRLRRAEAALDHAQAQAALARAERDASQRSWDEPIELQRAVESSRAALAEARAELERLPTLVASARATLTRLEEEFGRAEQSRKARASTEIELIIARQRLAAQRATTEALEAQRPVLEARIDRMRADLRAAERRLELRIQDRRRLDAAVATLRAAHAAVDRARAERDEAALELERMTIRAPISGFVQDRLVAPGDKLVRNMDGEHSAHLLHLYDPDRLQVRVDVPLADAAHIYHGQRCEIVVEVLPDRTFSGEVLRSTHKADLQKNTLEFKVRVSDPDPILRPEMLTRVKFLSSNNAARRKAIDPSSTPSRSRVLVPNEAIDDRDGSPHVWTVVDRRANRGTLMPITVEVLERNDGWSQIRASLTAGALVALDTAKARPGESVKINNSETVEADIPERRDTTKAGGDA
jgi:RND family efflux transporter MFP subunit